MFFDKDEDEEDRRIGFASLVNSINGNSDQISNKPTFADIVQSINPTKTEKSNKENYNYSNQKSKTVSIETLPAARASTLTDEEREQVRKEVEEDKKRGLALQMAEEQKKQEEKERQEEQEYKGFGGAIKKAAKWTKDLLVSLPVSVFNVGTGIGATIKENKKEREQKLDEMQSNGELEQIARDKNTSVGLERSKLLIKDTIADTLTNTANGFLITAATVLNFFAPNEDAKINLDDVKIQDYSPLKNTEQYGDFASKEDLTQYIQQLGTEAYKATGSYNPSANAVGSIAANMITAYGLQKLGMSPTSSFVTTGSISSLGQTGDVTKATQSGITSYVFGKVLDSAMMNAAISYPASERTRELTNTLMTKFPNLQNSDLAKSIIQELPNIASDFSSIFVSQEAAGQVGTVLNEKATNLKELLSWDNQKEILGNSLLTATVLAGLKGYDRVRFDVKYRQLGADEIKAQVDSWYETLGLEKNKEYSTNDLKSIYRKLAKQYHPDINPDSAEQMKEINAAYDGLLKYFEDGNIYVAEVTANPEKGSTNSKEGLTITKNKNGNGGSITIDTQLALNELNNAIAQNNQIQTIVPIQENGEVIGFSKKDALPIEIKNINPEFSNIAPAVVENEDGQTIDVIDLNTGTLLLGKEPSVESAIQKATDILETKDKETVNNIKNAIQDEEIKSINAINQIQDNIQQGVNALQAQSNADNFTKSTQTSEAKHSEDLSNQTTNNMSNNLKNVRTQPGKSDSVGKTKTSQRERKFTQQISEYKENAKKGNSVQDDITKINTNVLEGISKNKQDSFINEYLRDEVQGHDYYVDNDKIIANSTTTGKLSKGKTFYDKKIDIALRKELKANVISNLENIISTSQIYQSNRKDTKKHTFADTFDRRKSIFNYKGQNYEVMFEIGKKNGINTLYGIEHIKRTQKNRLNLPQLTTQSGLQNTQKSGRIS